MANPSNNINVWIINWFVNNSNLDKKEIKEKSHTSYLENGWIDSFKFINFISDIEEHFGITFSNDEFQNRSFSTIDGLMKIIQSKINEK